MGGEKVVESTLNVYCWGSPPHGRGKAFSVLRRQFRFRITPAWAGKRRQWEPCPSPERDHPRVGGEKDVSPCRASVPVGSPPHGRGKDGKFIRINESTGITPAWAGKRKEQLDGVKKSEDHPRMGGEKAPAAGHCSTDTGSPPRGRGKEVADEGIGGIIRITPAWAGKRTGASASWTTVRDHPRMGGEKSGPPR